MRTFLIVLLSILVKMETYPQNKSTDRQPAVAGSFYAADKETLTKDLTALFESCKKVKVNNRIRAIICPHAGYIFSGKTAAAAFSVIPENSTYRNIFLIGSSHVIAFDGASVYNSGDYITPMGKMPVNREIGEKLKSDNKVFAFPENPHLKEHSIEVQLPLIQYYFKTTPKIVPVIIGTDNKKNVKLIAEALKPYFTPENLFVISSDFSHYPAYNEAVEADRLTALGIESGDPDIFLNTLKKNSEKNIKGLATSMCGWTSGLTLLYLTDNNEKFKFSLVDYCNSGDSPYGGKDSVVGYNAIAVSERDLNSESRAASKQEFKFSTEEKSLLFKLARTSIESKLDAKNKNQTETEKMPSQLLKPLGAFVTLKINGKLRGCIGRFISTDPLYEVVKASAISSAFEDPRFLPLTIEEYARTEIEITVLGPLERINSKNEIILGKHGIYIKKDSRSGTMLPQVAVENNWSVDEFLGYTSRDKAGIGWDGWKNAELYIYEGVVLEEN